jgi:hypothetical protein
VDPGGLAVRDVGAEYRAQKGALESHRAEALAAANAQLSTYTQLQTQAAEMASHGYEDFFVRAEAQKQFEAFGQNMAIVAQDNEQLKALAASYKAITDVPSAIQGDQSAEREYREQKISEFDSACEASRQSLAANVAVLGYVLVQEGRNGRLDAEDHHNIRATAITVAGVTAVVGMAAAANKRGGGKPRVNRLRPEPSAQGAHSTFKRDPQTGKVTGHAEFNGQGNLVKRTDMTGASHGGGPTPHTHEYGPPNTNPATGQTFPGGETNVRPATPDEIP